MFACKEPASLSPLIYRDEVLGIIGALADLVVDVRGIREILEEDGEEEEEQEGDFCGSSAKGREHAERPPAS
jgi:hypothetical protein